MPETKYGKHLIPAHFELAKDNTGARIFQFSAADYGVDATWILYPITKPMESQGLPSHSHDFQQFISWFGSDPKNIGQYDAEAYLCLGAEQERHDINTPVIQNLSPGTPHCPGGWIKLYKPVYHLDVFFAPTWVKKDTTIAADAKQTSGKKYSHHFIPAPIEPARYGPPIPTLNFSAAPYGIDAGWFVVPVLEPRVMQEKPHKHDFPQFFSFIGSDPYDLRKFDAEIEVYLGEEGEKHVITEPTVLYIAPGMVHCPLIYKRVGQPVMHLDMYFAHEYRKIFAAK